jgi:hypothetical protein
MFIKNSEVLYRRLFIPGGPYFYTVLIGALLTHLLDLAEIHLSDLNYNGKCWGFPTLPPIY